MGSNETIRERDKKFIEQFLKNGTVVEPTESMLLPTDSIKELNDLIRQNKTHCFRTDPGVAGWCATCRVRPETVSRVTSRAALYISHVYSIT